MIQSDHTSAVTKRFSNIDSARRWSEMYSSSTNNLEEDNYRRRRDAAVKYVLENASQSSRVLDLGCGAAPVLSELRQQGILCTGLEYSSDMLAHAKQRLLRMNLPTNDLHLGDCRSTPFEDASYDMIVCLGVISYIEDYDTVLKEIDRLLKPGGRLLISYRNRFNHIYSDPIKMGKWALKSLVGRSDREGFFIGRPLDHNEFCPKMQHLGFAPEHFVGIGFGPIRINGRPLLGERASIGLSNALAAAFSTLNCSAAFKWLSDVSLWIYTKPEADARRSSLEPL